MFLFECISNLTGVYDCGSGLTRWKLQYPNSVQDKSHYFLNAQVSGTALLGTAFELGNVVVSAFEAGGSPSAVLVPRARSALACFDAAKYYVRAAFFANSDTPQPVVVSLASDNVVRVCAAELCAHAPPPATEHDVLQAMADMHS